MELINKNTGEALDLLVKAATLLHDTGDVESEELDQANSHLSRAIDKINLYLSYREL